MVPESSQKKVFKKTALELSKTEHFLCKSFGALQKT